MVATGGNLADLNADRQLIMVLFLVLEQQVGSWQNPISLVVGLLPLWRRIGHCAETGKEILEETIAINDGVLYRRLFNPLATSAHQCQNNPCCEHRQQLEYNVSDKCKGAP